MTHHLPDLSDATALPLHGVFSRDLLPALTVESGDEVVLSTLDAWWGLGDGDARRSGLAGHPHRDLGHALTGPIAVRGLVPGDVLAVELLELVPSQVGFTECGGLDSPLYRPLGCHTPPYTRLRWTIGPAHATTRLSGGVELRVPVAPFPGVIGLAPAAPGDHPTTPPRRTGGNLDCRLMTAGACLLLPVEVPGGLLSVGDGHAAQGDGELCNNGVECALPRVRLRLTRLPGPPPGLPRTPIVWRHDGLAVLGLGTTLDVAARDATCAMLDLLTSLPAMSRAEALGAVSVAADLAVTQTVNGTVGVHLTLWRHRLDAPELWSVATRRLSPPLP